MRFAILSDLHANLEATEAVLADARERDCTHYVCPSRRPSKNHPAISIRSPRWRSLGRESI